MAPNVAVERGSWAVGGGFGAPNAVEVSGDGPAACLDPQVDAAL